MKAMYAFKGLDAEYDLRGNWLLGTGQQLRPRFGDMHRGSRGYNGLASSST